MDLRNLRFAPPVRTLSPPRQETNRGRVKPSTPSKWLSTHANVEPASRRGDVRPIGQRIKNGVGGLLGGVDAVGNAHAVEGDAGQE
jgi:hypothetical protein